MLESESVDFTGVLSDFEIRFLVEQWCFLMVWKVVKCLILLGLLEVGIEVVF